MSAICQNCGEATDFLMRCPHGVLVPCELMICQACERRVRQNVAIQDEGDER